MTDKQIIIDGVDVSKCEWFGQIDLDINIICTLNSPKKCSGYCKDNPNCVYKQLARKEQECDRLKHDNDYQVGALEKTIDNLTAENEELKKQVCGLRPELKGLIDDTCCKYNIEVKTYHEKIVEIIHHLNIYDQTLTKIKEIAKNSCCLQPTSTCEEYENCKECSRTSDDETVK